MLFHVMDAALIGSRGMDLMNAIMEGLASKSAKTNIKYGSAMTFVRVVAIMF